MKTINVESPTHFWSLIKSREEIFEDNQSLTKFISKDTEIYELLKKEFECEEIIFN